MAESINSVNQANALIIQAQKQMDQFTKAKGKVEPKAVDKLIAHLKASTSALQNAKGTNIQLPAGIIPATAATLALANQNQAFALKNAAEAFQRLLKDFSSTSTQSDTKKVEKSHKGNLGSRS